MKYTIISADSHIDLTWMPGDLWVNNAPSHVKDRVPRVVETKDGLQWMAEGGKNLGKWGGFGLGGMKHPQRGDSKHSDRMLDVGYFEGGAHPTTPELRLKDMELDGLDAEVIYGILGVGLRLSDPKLTALVYEVYNTWVADFARSRPGRWAALACLPFHDPQAAAAELRRAAKLGLKGADFAVAHAIKPIWHRDWDVLWATAAECRMSISFHPSTFPGRAPDDAQTRQEYRAVYAGSLVSVFQMVPGAEHLASIIFSGACDRYPDFKFVLGESGVGWIPYVLNRMDEEYDDRQRDLNYSLKPSEMWHRSGFTTYQHERDLATFLPLVGEDNVMWGSDYPHPDGVFPDSREKIAQDLAGVSKATQRKLTHDNAGKLYGFLS